MAGRYIALQNISALRYPHFENQRWPQERIAQIMAERVARNLDFASKLRRSVAGLLILAATACLAAAFTPEVFGQGSPSPATPAFEVADVHASPYVRFPFMDGGDFTGDRY